MQFEELAKAFKQKELPESEVEFTGELPVEALARYRDRALKHLAESLELPGFRKGMVPPEMAQKKLGEGAVLEECVELLLRDFYPELIQVKKVDAVGRPDIRITKLVPGEPVALTIATAVYPKVELPYDWKNIGRDIAAEPAASATEEEISQTLESLRQSRKAGEAVPELTDEFAKSLGAFDSLEALKESIRKGIGEEKVRAARDKRRGAILDALVGKTRVAVPALFVESELDKILGQMKDDLAKTNLPFEEYLKRAGKTEAAARDDFREQAKKRAILQLALNTAADEAKLAADEAAIEEEIKHALEHFPDARLDALKVHIETVLRNEQVLQLLEGGGVKE